LTKLIRAIRDIRGLIYQKNIKMNKFNILFSLFCLFSMLTQAQNNSFAVQATVEQGIIEGNYDTKTGIQKYFGVPFAKPPVGNLRWKAPQPLDKWQGVKQTKQFAARPMQKLIWGDMNSRSNGVSEDCLYLNVWSPASRNTKNLPVLVYFFGGGFVAGDGSEPRYDGETMAKKGIVVVTVNYRLNIFGFFAHPELSAEAPYKASGNYGLLDQAASLAWVQKNIASFGGDPKKVTIAGESAGSIAVSAQMISPLSKNLIAGAIGESGSMLGALPPVSLAEAEKTGLEFATKAGYSSLESGRFGFPGVLDGYFYPKDIAAVFSTKSQAQVPLLLGWNSAEMNGMAFMEGQPLTAENYAAKVKKAYPDDVETVLKLYPSGSERDIEVSATHLASDRFISYSTWKWFDLHRKNSSQPVYRYLYSKLRPALVDNTLAAGLAGGTAKKDPNAPKPREAVGAPHACEIEYCMGNLSLIKEFAWTDDDFKVSETMSNYFANFIKTGNPNGEKLPNWAIAKADDATPPVMIIDVNSRTEKAQNEARYEFLDKKAKNK
jgi:para-nitrobenzyl esterase